MPNTTNQLADLTSEIYAILDQRGVRSFDGHIVLDVANPTKGTISGRVLHAHDEAELLRFTLAVAL
jgi:hypothetical protein